MQLELKKQIYIGQNGVLRMMLLHRKTFLISGYLVDGWSMISLPILQRIIQKLEVVIFFTITTLNLMQNSQSQEFKQQKKKQNYNKNIRQIL